MVAVFSRFWRSKLASTADGRATLNGLFKICPKSNLTKPEDLSKFTGKCARIAPVAAVGYNVLAHRTIQTT